MNYDKAPFPWFGGKSKAADLVWKLLAATQDPQQELFA